jgi:hypothetical protein
MITSLPLQKSHSIFLAGNVGIGLPNPSAKLHVAGTAIVGALTATSVDAGVGTIETTGAVNAHTFSASNQFALPNSGIIYFGSSHGAYPERLNIYSSLGAINGIMLQTADPLAPIRLRTGTSAFGTSDRIYIAPAGTYASLLCV